VNKARGALGTPSKEFYYPYNTKTLFISRVRPILEYGSPVWSPQCEIHVDRIDSVQNNLLLFALRRLKWDVSLILPSNFSILLLINFPLPSQPQNDGTDFIFNPIRGEFDSPDLVSQLNFFVPSRLSRNYNSLNLNHCRPNYNFHEAFRALQQVAVYEILQTRHLKTIFGLLVKSR